MAGGSARTASGRVDTGSLTSGGDDNADALVIGRGFPRGRMMSRLRLGRRVARSSRLMC